MVFMAHFDGVHAFGYNSAGIEAIWIKIGALLSILFAAGPGKGHIAVSYLSNYIEPSIYRVAMHLIRSTSKLWK